MLYSHAKKIQILREGINALKETGRPYDYLEMRLNDLLSQMPQDPKTEVNAFEETPSDCIPGYISDREVKQMQSFGFVLDGNPYAHNDKLMNHPVWRRHHNG